MRKWIMHSGEGIVSLILLVTIIGVVYEQVSRSRAARGFPPQGKLVDIGGRRIQLDCRGYVLTGMAQLSLDRLSVLKISHEQGRQYQSIWKAMHDEEASCRRIVSIGWFRMRVTTSSLTGPILFSRR
jgi:hypothetical protein